VVLFSGDSCRQLTQPLSVILRFCLHGAFPRPVAERPVFGFCRYVRALRNGVRTLHLQIQNRETQPLWSRVHGCGPLSGGRACRKVPTGFRRSLYSIYCMPSVVGCSTRVPPSYSVHGIPNLRCVGYPTIPKAVVEGSLTVPKNDKLDDLHAPMHCRRLDDRIRELCVSLVASTEHQDGNQILSELKVALHESIERLRMRVAGALSGRRDFQDRRKAS
jgi:hypothetical protein